MSARALQPELMDDPAIDPAVHDAALAGLARLNRLSRAVPTLWTHVRAEAQRLARPIRLLDVATGSGDVPIGLAQRARRAAIQLELHACDISPHALEIAASKAQAAGVALHTHRFDIESSTPLDQFDVVTCSLFMHHLTEPGVVHAMTRMAEATQHLLLISDLRRSRLGCRLVWAASRLVTRSQVVHVDAVRSMQAAFTIPEFTALARQAGLDGVHVRPAPPQRMLLVWRRP